MKIAMIGHKRIPSREGGVEVVVEELSVRMAEKGHDITVYNRRGRHIGGKEFNTDLHAKKYKGVRIVEVPTIDQKGLAAVTSSFFATMKAIFRDYDCIHYHAEGPAVMLLPAHLAGKRTVVTIHGLDWQRRKWGRFASWYLHLGERIAARYADEVIVLSESAEQYFWRTYRRKAILIPNGVRRPMQRPADEISRSWQLSKDSYLLYLGRIVPEKEVECLIEAFRHLDTDKKLVIAGSGSDTQSYYQLLQKIAAEDGRILFTGFVQGTLLDELYSNAYLYCLPSGLEGMPLSLLEAMSYGNCCLTADIPECTSVTGKHGFSFPRGSIGQLQTMLQQLCDCPELVQQKKAGVIDAVCSRYSWDETVDRTLRAYLGCVPDPVSVEGNSHENFNGE